MRGDQIANAIFRTELQFTPGLAFDPSIAFIDLVASLAVAFELDVSTDGETVIKGRGALEVNFRVGHEVDRGLASAGVSNANFLPHVTTDAELDLLCCMSGGDQASCDESSRSEEDLFHFDNSFRFTG